MGTQKLVRVALSNPPIANCCTPRIRKFLFAIGGEEIEENASLLIFGVIVEMVVIVERAWLQKADEKIDVSNPLGDFKTLKEISKHN